MTQRTRKNSGLTPDDEHLWAFVTDSVHPMRRTHRSSPARDSDDALQPDHTRQSSHASVKPTMPDLARIATPSPGKPRWQPLITEPTPRPRPTTAATPQTFDRRQARRIATGKVEIEGRLDLHGLRELEAHVRLRGFLRQAQAQGKRTVLVITGKGIDNDHRDLPFDIDSEHLARGVLRRNVPRWLAQPDVAPLIVSYTSAHQRHGGEGALYVHLRRG